MNALRLLLEITPVRYQPCFFGKDYCSLTGILGRTENSHWVRSASLPATLQPGGMWVEETGVGSGLPRVPHQVTWVVSLSSSSPCFSVHPHLLLHSPSLPTHHSSFMPRCAVNPAQMPSFHCQPTQSLLLFLQMLTQAPPPLSLWQ